MAVNPQISAYLAAGLARYDYQAGYNEKLYKIMLEYQPDFSPGFAPAFRKYDGAGLAFSKIGQRRNSIYVQLKGKEVLGTLYHELFHTAYCNIPESEIGYVEAFGKAIRERNVDFSHPDSRPVAWIEESEEAEAYAFERFATGRPMPFDLRLPPKVQATFRAVLRGKYAHHRARMRGSP